MEINKLTQDTVEFKETTSRIIDRANLEIMLNDINKQIAVFNADKQRIQGALDLLDDRKTD